ncbi:MAG: DNA alkylation repair protein [Prevotella sp.]|nr:DNA alkylation repair protein [Prevotella sp.]
MDDIKDIIKEIKKSFRLFMNGVASRSMREKGLDYKINWGLTLPQLKQLAAQYDKNAQLAIELWKDDVRECKILATLLMPAEEMSIELAELWMEQTHSQEMAEMLAFNLYQHLDFAPALAYKWMASEDIASQICAYQILARLFMQGKEPNERGINEFIDQAMTALQNDNIGLKHAVMNCIQHFSNLGLLYERLIQSALKKLDAPQKES